MNFSRRLSWDAQENRLAQVLAARQKAAEVVLDLTISNPTEVGLSSSDAALAQVLAPAGAARYQPCPLGLPSARAAVAAYQAKGGVAVDADDVVITVSSSESYAHLFKLLCDPGTRIAIPQPSYPLFEYLAALESVTPVPYRLSYDGDWSIDFDSLHAALATGCRVIVVVNPNNPTGSHLRAGDRDRLFDLCARHDCALIVDEVFADHSLLPRTDAIPRIASAEAPCLVFVLGGLSKSCALPQLKLGWMLLHGPAAQRQRAREGLSLIADTYLSVATPVQLALADLFALGEANRRRIATHTRRNLDALARVLQGSAADVLHVEAGWSAIVRVPALHTEEDWALHLLQIHGVLVQPGYFFDLDVQGPGTCLVVSLLTPTDVFDRGIAALRRMVDAGA